MPPRRPNDEQKRWLKVLEKSRKLYELRGQTNVPSSFKNKEHHDHAKEEEAYNGLRAQGWDETDIFKPPVVAIREHMGLFPGTAKGKLADKYHLDRKVVKRLIAGGNQAMGRPTALSKADEILLVQHVYYWALRGVPMSREEVCDVVCQRLLLPAP